MYGSEGVHEDTKKNARCQDPLSFLSEARVCISTSRDKHVCQTSCSSLLSQQRQAWARQEQCMSSSPLTYLICGRGMHENIKKVCVTPTSYLPHLRSEGMHEHALQYAWCPSLSSMPSVARACISTPRKDAFRPDLLPTSSVPRACMSTSRKNARPLTYLICGDGVHEHTKILYMHAVQTSFLPDLERRHEWVHQASCGLPRPLTYIMCGSESVHELSPVSSVAARGAWAHQEKGVLSRYLAYLICSKCMLVHTKMHVAQISYLPIVYGEGMHEHKKTYACCPLTLPISSVTRECKSTSRKLHAVKASLT